MCIYPQLFLTGKFHTELRQKDKATILGLGFRFNK